MQSPNDHERRPHSLELAVKRLRRRVHRARLLGHLGRHLCIALFVGGTLALLLRAFAELERSQAAWSFGFVAVAPLSAWWFSRRERLSEEGAAACLDLWSGGSGLLLTGLETDDPAWRERAETRLGEVERDAHLRVARVASPVLPALLYAVGALLVGITPQPPAEPQNLFAGAVDRLEERLATLEEQVQVDEELAAELSSALGRMREEATSLRPEASFEALDRLEERMESEALEALEAAESGSESLAQAAATAMQDGGLAEAQEELESAMAELAEDGLLGEMPETLAELMEASGLEGAEVSQAGVKVQGLTSMSLPEGVELGDLLQLSEEMRQALAEKMQRLAEAGLLREAQLAQLERLAKLGSLDASELQFVEHTCDSECKAGGT